MAIKEGIENETNTESIPLSEDDNPRLGVGTSQFVLMEQRDLTLEQTKDDLFGAVKSGDTVKVGALTGREPDVTHPDPSGTTHIERGADQTRGQNDFETEEQNRLNQLDVSGDISLAGDDPDGVATAANPLGLRLQQRHRHTPGTALDIFDAIEEGDYTALAQIRLANARRELNEHIDVNGDGHILGGERGPISGVFTEDKYGIFHSADEQYAFDQFGGTYDAYGYRFKDGSYTNRSGEHYNAATNVFTEKNGRPMDVPNAVKQIAHDDPDAGSDYLQMASAEQHRLDAGTSVADKPASGGGTKAPAASADSSQPHVQIDSKAAAQHAGGGQQTTQAATSTTARNVAAIAVAMKVDDKKSGRTVKPNWKYLPPAERLEWKLRQEYGSEYKKVLADKKRLMRFVHEQQEQEARAAHGAAAKGAPADPKAAAPASDDGFTAVSADEAAKLLHSQPIVHHPATADAGGKTPASSGDKVETSTSTTWYADKNGGFFDQYGGYYDKTGAYWDADGTYYSPDGKFSIDPKGATHWTDGSYTDTHGHTVDKDGNYVDFDGTRIKPPPGVDFKKQMMEADEKGEKWTPPARPTPIAADKEVLPTTLLTDLPFTFNLNPLELPTVPLTPVPLQPPAADAGSAKITAPTSASANTGTKTSTIAGTAATAVVTTPTIATDTKADAGLKIDTSHFMQASCTSSAPVSSFSSIFGGVHDWLMGGDSGGCSVQDTKFSPLTTSPTTSLLSSTAAVTTPLVTTTGTKPAQPAPKLGV